jgi:hypothetical protein
MFRRVLETRHRVAAPADVAWAVLTDLAGHASWNRYAPRWSGVLEPGGAIEIVARPGGTERRFHATVEEVRPHRLAYRAAMGGGLLMRMYHEIELVEASAAACTVVQRETIAGPIVPLAWPIFRRQAGAGFAQMNEDLGRAAEARAGRRRP